MNLSPSVAFLVLLFVLFLYATSAAIDFGAGALWLWSLVRGREDVARVAMRYSSPVWEVVNVFFILFAVGTVGYFPQSLPLLGTAMLVPGALGLGAVAVRALSFLLRGASPSWAPRLFPWLLGITGVVAPLPFVTLFALLGGDALGPSGVDLTRLFLSPMTLVFMFTAVSAEFALGGLFLSYYAQPSAEPWAARTLSALAQPWTALYTLGLVGVLVVVAAQRHTWPVATWPLFALGLAGNLTALALARRQPGGALLAALLGSLAGLMGQAVWQLPWLIWRRVPLASVFTSPTMAEALTWVLLVGVVLVTPSLMLLGKLVLEDARRAARAKAA